MKPLSFLRPDLQLPPNVKILYNIGATLDLPTGFWIQGKRGEWILVGGLGQITAVVGRGNRFKSTFMHFMMLSAMNRMLQTVDTAASTYDTEINIHETALKRFFRKMLSFVNRDIIDEGTWKITDKTMYYANKWYEDIKTFLKEKMAHIKEATVTTPFISRDGVSNMTVIVPTFCEVDSFSEFETDNIANMQNENELGDSGGLTIHMRQGLDKTRFLMEVPTLFGKSQQFLLMTAHVDDVINVASGPYAPQPVKKLQHMKQGDKVKGVTSKFFFLMNNCWNVLSAAPMITKDKTPDYPKATDDNRVGDMDLHLLTIQQLRGKAGQSGYNLEIVVSQREGVLPSLTEFHFLKTNDRFGLGGNVQNFHLDIYPDVKLSRTTVRRKIDEDLKLQRALNITAELAQMWQWHREFGDLLCTPLELYNDIKAAGYDWDMILSETRGWWTFNDDDHPLKFLSIVDLLYMRRGVKPYWMK